MVENPRRLSSLKALFSRCLCGSFRGVTRFPRLIFCLFGERVGGVIPRSV